MKKIIICLIVLLLFSGYTPYDELNSLAVVDVLGLDFKDNKYLLYLNIINDDNKVYQVKGDSLGEVFLKAKNIDNKKTYYNHLEIMVFNTNILNNNKILTFLKDEFTSIDYLVFSTDDSLDKLFKKYHKNNDYKSFIKKEKEESGSIINVTFKDFLSSSLDDIKTSSIPLISYNNNLRSEGIYLPTKNAYLNRVLARTNYLLNGSITTYNEKLKINNNYYETILYDLKTKINYKNKNLKIEITGKVDSPDTSDLTEVKKEATRRLKNNIKDLITDEISKEYNISNVINYIYLKTGSINFKSYKNASVNIDIKLKEERKNNYD